MSGSERRLLPPLYGYLCYAFLLPSRSAYSEHAPASSLFPSPPISQHRQTSLQHRQVCRYYYYNTAKFANYTGVLLAVNEYALDQGIPYRNVLLDR